MPLRQVLGAGHVHADAGQREHGARDAAQRGPAHRQRRQDHRGDDRPRRGRAPSRGTTSPHRACRRCGAGSSSRCVRRSTLRAARSAATRRSAFTSVRPVSYSSFAEERRTLPLEVFGTPRGGTSTMSSAAEPAIAVTTSCAAAISFARASGLVSLVSAITIRRSVPFCRIGRAERRDAALADAGDRRDRFLDLVRIGVAAGADDDVLDAPGDVDVAARDVGAVAALDPAVVEQLARLRLVAEIALGHRGPAEFQHALLALAELAAGVVDDAHVVLLDRMAAGDHLERVRIVRRRPAPRSRAWPAARA